VPLGLLGAGELVGLGSVAGWGIVSRGVARWKAWGQTAAVDVFFGLEVLDSDFRLSFSCCHSICFLVALKVTPHRGIEPTMRFLELLSCRRDRVERDRVDRARAGRDHVDRDRVGRGRVERDRRLWRLSLA